MNKNQMIILALLTVFFMSCPDALFATNGYFLPGVGAVNESLGGAATAGNVQDVVGSLHRNPANAVLFDGRVSAINFGVIFPEVTANSSVDMLGLSGSTDSDVDTIPIASMGIVFHDKNSPMAYYFGLIGEAGISLDFSQGSTNPLFIAQAGKADNPYGGLFGGFGDVVSQIEVYRLPIGGSYQVDKNWSLGFSVAPSVARLKLTPGVFAAPDDANGDGIPTYPTDVDHELAAGIGFQVGTRWQTTEKLGIGFTFTSPTWFEDFNWDVTDEIDNNRKVSFRLDRPLVLNMGSSYQLTPDTLFLMDCSWINYSGTKGFDETGFNADGSLRGLGWNDIWVLSFGVQQNIDKLSLRAGYNYGGNPIDADTTFFNSLTPLITQHHLSLGGSYTFKLITLDIAYTHAFENTVSGPIYDMSGPVAGTNVEYSMAYDQFSVAATFTF